MISTPAAPKASEANGFDSASQAIAAAWQRAYAPQASTSLKPDHAQTNPCITTHRGAADAMAAWQRWHQPHCASLFNPVQWPWYAVLEQARVETLAGDDLPGMASNLAEVELLSPAHAPLRNLYQTARAALSPTGAAIPYPQLLEVNSKPVTFLDRWFKRAVINTPAHTQTQIIDTLRRAQFELHDGQRFAQTVRPLVQALAAHHAGAASGDASLPGNPRPNADGVPQQEEPNSEMEQLSPEGEASATTPPGLTAERAYPGYKVWTHQWDEEGPAAKWLSPQDGDALQQLQALDHTKAKQLAHRLQRRLLAARLRHWNFDQEEGRLDSRRLAQLLANEGNPRVFRVEAEAPIPEACVTLLVDQSGSMRGTRQQMTAQAIDLAVHTLQACQIRCEVLGYTSRYGAYNPLANQWRQAGSPPQPGRLNALRHIIYKTPAQLWQRNRNQLGLLLREGFGRENIDGEALHWAACRLMRQTQPRKILVVLSDGSPYDQATTQANGRTYLENHLHEVIAEIKRSPIHLVAMGAGQDVGRYYRHALTLNQPAAVAEVLFAQLADLLTQPM